MIEQNENAEGLTGRIQKFHQGLCMNLDTGNALPEILKKLTFQIVGTAVRWIEPVHIDSPEVVVAHRNCREGRPDSLLDKGSDITARAGLYLIDLLAWNSQQGQHRRLP